MSVLGVRVNVVTAYVYTGIYMVMVCVIVLQLALGATRCRSSSATRRIPISRPLLNAATSIWQTARVPFNAHHLLRLLSQMLIELAVRKHHFMQNYR